MAARNRERTRDKRRRILDAATKVFAKNGFYNAKVSQIAKEAAVADGTIYLYFKNKDDILITIFEEAMDMILGIVREEIAKEQDAISKLRRFIILHMQLMERYPRLAEVLQVELRQSSKFMKDYTPVKFIDYIGLAGSIVEEGQEQGLIRRDITPAVFKRMLFGALDELSLQWVLSKRKYKLSDSADLVSDCFMRGISTADGQVKAGRIKDQVGEEAEVGLGRPPA